MDKHITSINLGESALGLSLKIDILKTDGTILSGCSDITSGIIEVGNGTYSFYYDKYPDNFVGIIRIKDSNGNILTSCGVEPVDEFSSNLISETSTVTIEGWYGIALQFIDQYISSESYTATQWKRRLNISARESIKESFPFALGYSIDCSGNVEDWEISPDPISDMDFVEFVAWKTICNIYTKTLQDKMANAAHIKDGTSEIDTRSSLDIKFIDKTPYEIFNQMLSSRYPNNSSLSALHTFASELRENYGY
jgi:hypothetical protein